MSFKNEYTLNVDIKRRMTSVVPTFKQGDSATLKFKIFDDGKKFDLAAFTRAEITFKLPSGQTIVGEPYIDVNTQMIVYNFVGVEMNEAGKLTTILSIYSGTSMVSIQPFSIFIFDHLKDKDLSYIGILQDLIAEVQLLNEEVKSTLSEANNLKDELNDVLIEANSAEQTRNTNEQNRITSENTRNSNESARQQNELDRKNAESIRESNEATRIENEQNRQKEFDNKINEAEVAITDTKNATEKANQVAESIKGWGQATVWNSTTTYSKNNVVTYNGSTWQSKGDNNLNSIPSETNTNWILLALRGVDGTGAVSTVNGKSPDGAGNVELTADEIGTFTQQQINDKDTAIKEYFTDKGIGDKVIVISEQDYIDADYNGMFWVKNDALDFLPTETDHAATLLVYENPDNENVVKIFNIINPTTAISYMRTYTYDNTSSLIHDSGWIEGGGGSGTGGGNVSVNSYPLVTDTVNQVIWELPTGVYNQTTDSVMIFHNTIFLDQVSYTLTNNRLSIPDNPHTEIAKNNVVMVVFRNMPNMSVEFDGNNIVDGSISLSKLGQDVQDAIASGGNSYLPVIESKDFYQYIIDNKTGRVFVGSNAGTGVFPEDYGYFFVEFSTAKTTSEYQEFKALHATTNKNYTRVASIYKDDNGNFEAHFDSDWEEVGDTDLAKNSWQKNEFNDTDITNLSTINVSRVFYIAGWKAPATNIEQVSIVLPAINFNGTVKVTVTGGYNNTDAFGTFEYVTHYAKIGNTVYAQQRTVFKADTKVATEYYFPDFNRNEHVVAIPIVRKPNAINNISVKVELLTTQGGTFEILKDATLVYEDLGTTWHSYPWTPQASNIPTNTQINNWDSVAHRFKPACTAIDDWNVTLENGFYMTAPSATSNAPDNDSWWMGTVTRHDHLHVVQKVNCVTNDREYQRRSNGGNWGAWVETSPMTLFPSVSSGKQGLASAITGKGVPTDANDSFPTMINNINAIPTGAGYSTGAITVNTSMTTATTYLNGSAGPTMYYFDISNLSFTPKFIIAVSGTGTILYQSIMYANDTLSTNWSVKTGIFNTHAYSSTVDPNRTLQRASTAQNIYRVFVPATGSYNYHCYG